MKEIPPNKYLIPIVVGAVVMFSNCLPYLTTNRGESMVDAIDMDQTLRVAEQTMAEDKWGSVLTIWVVRDQHVTPDQAKHISRLYFENIGRLRRNFNIWHLTWAVANVYRLGDSEVQQALQGAYDDACKRAIDLGGSAKRHTTSDTLYHGDAHGGGRAYAKRHIVAPGNPSYLQSYDEFLEKNRRARKTTNHKQDSNME